MHPPRPLAIHPALPPAERRSEFGRVFNLRSVAVVWLICAVHSLSRLFIWALFETKSTGEWAVTFFELTRQALICGLLVLLFIALAESALARWPALPDLPRLAARTLALAAGALLGTWARISVYEWLSNDFDFHWSWFVSTAGLWFILGGMGYALMVLLRRERAARIELQGASREHETLQAQQLEAQVSALNAQIEPHFLFNTLANVKRLYETSPERGRDMLRSLIAYLRAALPSMRQQDSTLDQELNLVRNYLTILQMRMGERLSFSIAADPELLSARLPPMVLPTLVENAIKHGLSALPEGGRIEIEARQSAPGQLAVEVRDNGQGFSASSGSGVGLANTRARLAALFGEGAALELESAQPRGVIARLRMPLLGAVG